MQQSISNARRNNSATSNVINLASSVQTYITASENGFDYTAYLINNDVSLGASFKIFSNAATKPTISLDAAVTNVHKVIEVNGSEWIADEPYDMIGEVEPSHVAGKFNVLWYFAKREVINEVTQTQP